MGQSIQLRLINDTDDFENNVCVIMQKNLLTAPTASPTAWQLIANLAPGEAHSFTFSDLSLLVSDRNGNLTKDIPAHEGMAYQMEKDPGMLVLKGDALEPDQIDVLNPPDEGIGGGIYVLCKRSGNLLASVFPVQLGQTASFKFDSNIFLGVITMEDAQKKLSHFHVLSPDLLPYIDTEISLLGISSADIVMSGGPGAFTFTLENVASD